jgi:hypothetical protein
VLLNQGTEQGILLVTGQVLCQLCAVRWNEQAKGQLLLNRGEECAYLKDTSHCERK